MIDETVGQNSPYIAMTCEEIAEATIPLFGRKMSRQRIAQILRTAEDKLRDGLRDVAADWWGDEQS